MAKYRSIRFTEFELELLQAAVQRAKSVAVTRCSSAHNLDERVYYAAVMEGFEELSLKLKPRRPHANEKSSNEENPQGQDPGGITG